MRKSLLITCLSFLFFNAISQEVNYIPYYQLVSKAKVAKYQQNCDSAIIYYTQAFAMVDYILIEDLQNFTQCAIAVNNDSLVYFAMERCKLQTIPVTFIITEDSSCEKYKQTEQWNTYRADEIENWDAYTKKFITTPAIILKILDSLLVSDQAVRNNLTWYCRIFRKSKIFKTRIRELIVTDSCNQRAVDEMIQKYGFPNERMGLDNNYSLYRGGCGLVLFHYNDSNFLFNVEYKALVEGKVSPDCYATKANQKVRLSHWDKQLYTYYYSKRKSKKMTPQEKARVDKNRYAIGLPSVEEEEMIKQFNRQEIKKRKANTIRKK